MITGEVSLHFKAICPSCGKPCRVVTKNLGRYTEQGQIRRWIPYKADFSLCCDRELVGKDFEEFYLLLKDLFLWLKVRDSEDLKDYLAEKGEGNGFLFNI